MTCVTYARVSSEEQANAGYSIDYQRLRLEEYATEHAFSVAARFEDVHSAKEAGRPGFQRMLEFLEANPRVRTLVVHRVDRLSRNLYQYALVVERLGVQVCSIMEPAENSAAGRMTHGMSAVVAKYHSDNLRAEVLKGMRAKFEAGGCVARAPVGYKNVSRTKTDRAKVVVDSDLAPVVQHMFARYARGDITLQDLAREGFELGLGTRGGRKPFPSSRLKELLLQPFYVGQVRYRGQLRDGIHEPLISRKLFDNVQAQLTRRQRDPVGHGRFYLLRGLLECGRCRRKLTAEEHPTKNAAYYRCLAARDATPCGAPYIRVEAMDQAVLALVKLAEAPRARLEDQRKALAAEEMLRQEARRVEEPELETARAVARTKLRGIAEMAAAGTLTQPEFIELRAKLDGELVDIDDRLAFLRNDFTSSLREREATLEIATSLSSYIALASDAEERKLLLRRVFRTIEVTDKHITKVEYKPPFDGLLFNPLISLDNQDLF